MESITFIERDPTVIMAESKAALEELLGRELQPAQVEQLILQFVVYREVLLTNRFNAGMSQMLYQFSKAPILDYIAALVAVERLPSASAGCTVRFTLIKGHNTVLIPIGTRVATGNGNTIFTTSDDILATSEINSVDIKVTAEIPGKNGNGYDIGTVIKILDPLAFVSTVENIDITGGGSDVETDEQLRERIKLAPSQYSSAGSRSSYKFYAKSANAQITDVSIDSPVPGTVLIVPLTDANKVSEQIIMDVYRACSPEDVRPLSDTVIVSAPTIKEYEIRINATLYEDADADSVKAAVMTELDVYTKSKRERLGQDIILSHITQICRMSSIYDVEIALPETNITVGDAEFAACNRIEVNITGFNRG